MYRRNRIHSHLRNTRCRPHPPRNKKGQVVKDGDSFKDPLFLPDDSKAQQFKWLSTLSDALGNDILNALNEFVNAYGEWIDIKCAEYNAAHPYGKIAGQELEKCRTDFERMKNNISELLTGIKNSGNLLCFRLMNTAMFMQLWHGVKNKNARVKDQLPAHFTCFEEDFYKEHADDKLFPPYSQPASWRAFQLAFILLNLDGIFPPESDPSWQKRNKWVDLVWFPTGGGKTEAYLGLIALTILNRRRTQGERGGGTAAIMRYTLRLLTMQQFQRATLMIMALELIRRWELYELGKEPIYIGFWVGNSSIPNKLTSTNWRDLNKEDDSLRAEFRKLQEGKENKIPFHVCPWCGDNLNPIPDRGKGNAYNIDRLNLHCHNPKCAFVENRGWEKHKYRGPIPVNLCDASIYQHPPTLLFGTVDKFAQLAHKVSDDYPNADSRRLFGKGKWETGKPPAGYLPPDLIIQDELHLLLGPLGSAVALFEAAIDQLCMRKDGTRPKIISSTATTRNTELQIAAVFDRKVDLFPKPGVECDDSFYACYKREHTDEDRSKTAYISKRKYMGLLPTGRTQIWMQMRFEAILLTHRALWELKELGTGTPIQYEQYKTFEKVMDYYHTTLSYFNSLKEVGKTQSQIQSYILKETRRVFTRVIRPRKLMHALYTYGPLVEGELTGRLNGEEVKQELKRVHKTWTAENRFAVREGDKTIIGDVPPELVVAINMISVGIDVSRFNTILMNSMPRNTAEYIQASSRVARDNYGLVLTVHHPFRARDVSHYEHFIEFHEKMYSYVEPISITPFTGKAVDRYMGLYLATIIRHTENNLGDRKKARNILNYSRKNLPRLTETLLQYFTARQERLKEFPPAIQNILREKDVKYIHRWIDEALAEWHQKATDANKEKKEFVFNNKTQGQEQLFIDIDEYEGNIDSKKWQIPQSLRVIEPQAAIHIHSK